MHRPRERSDTGFTLVELMVVVAIIAVLVGIAVATYGMTTSRAKRAACLTNQSQLSLAVSMYSAENSGTTPAALDDLAPFIRSWSNARLCPGDHRDLLLAPGGNSVYCSYPGHEP